MTDRSYVHVTEFIGSLTQARATARVAAGDFLEIVHADDTITRRIQPGVWIRCDIYGKDGQHLQTLRATSDPWPIGMFAQVTE